MDKVVSKVHQSRKFKAHFYFKVIEEELLANESSEK